MSPITISILIHLAIARVGSLESSVGAGICIDSARSAPATCLAGETVAEWLRRSLPPGISCWLVIHIHRSAPGNRRENASALAATTALWCCCLSRTFARPDASDKVASTLRHRPRQRWKLRPPVGLRQAASLSAAATNVPHSPAANSLSSASRHRQAPSD